MEPKLSGWKEGQAPQTRLAGQIVFHAALWRTFGSTEFIEALPFMHDLDSWSPDTWHPVLHAATKCWERGALCFTQAYGPARFWRKREIKLLKAKQAEELKQMLEDSMDSLTVI